MRDKRKNTVQFNERDLEIIKRSSVIDDVLNMPMNHFKGDTGIDSEINCPISDTESRLLALEGYAAEARRADKILADNILKLQNIVSALGKQPEAINDNIRRDITLNGNIAPCASGRDRLSSGLFSVTKKERLQVLLFNNTQGQINAALRIFIIKGDTLGLNPGQCFEKNTIIPAHSTYITEYSPEDGESCAAIIEIHPGSAITPLVRRIAQGETIDFLKAFYPIYRFI